MYCQCLAFLGKSCCCFVVCWRVNSRQDVYSPPTVVPFFFPVVAEFLIPGDTNKGFATSSKCNKYPKIFNITAGSAAVLAAFWYVRKRCICVLERFTPVRSWPNSPFWTLAILLWFDTRIRFLWCLIVLDLEWRQRQGCLGFAFALFLMVIWRF